MVWRWVKWLGCFAQSLKQVFIFLGRTRFVSTGMPNCDWKEYCPQTSSPGCQPGCPSFYSISNRPPTPLPAMARQFIRTSSTKIAVLFLISLCLLLVFFRGHREKFPKHLSLTPQTDPLDTSLTKVSGVWNASYAEYKYKNGWSVPDDPGFIRYIQEKWLHKPSGIKPNLPAKSYSQFGEDTFVKELLQDRRNGFFLEAGALDGVRFSNTLGLELSHNWTGLLVEPDPSSFAALLEKKRNAYAIRTCLSADKSEVLTFIHNTNELAIASLEDTNRQKQ